MTSKEALEVLNNPLKKEHWNLQNEAYNLLTDLVDKDTPKQVVDYGGVRLNCPVCYMSIKEHEQKYCYYCGQKLKW